MFLYTSSVARIYNLETKKKGFEHVCVYERMVQIYMLGFDGLSCKVGGNL